MGSASEGVAVPCLRPLGCVQRGSGSDPDLEGPGPALSLELSGMGDSQESFVCHVLRKLGGGSGPPRVLIPPLPHPPVVQVSSQTDQLHLQPGRAEAVVHESHQPATSVPFSDGEGGYWGLGQPGGQLGQV